MRLRYWLGCLAMCLLAPLQAYAETQIKSVRIWRAPDNTRLVFDLTGQVEHNVFSLTGPDRIVIDVRSAQLQANIKDILNTRSPVRDVRTGKKDNELRIVLDLSSRVYPKSFTLAPNQQYGHRLVVDLFDNPIDETGTVTRTQPEGKPVATVTPPVQKTPVKGGQRDVVIAIDAGHGGEDPGAIGPGGLKEKDVVLAIARELQRQINAEKGFRAELVRTGDYFIPLRKRTDIARQKGADLFVSVHADAAPRTTASGASVYALSDKGATSETARWLADSENRSDLIGGTGNVSLGDKDKVLAGVLLDLSMTASLSSSLDVGQKVLNHMGKVTRLHKSKVEQAAFMVLKSPDIPSILVETGFISNPEESRKLNNKSHQLSIARSIHAGVKQYFQINPPPGTWLAAQRDAGKTVIGPQEHVVRSGESLSMLAARYQVSMAEIRQASNLKSDVIKVGQKLTIPARNLAAQP